MSDEIQVSFDFKGKHYDGHLSAVHGGGVHHYHLMIENYYYGRLRFLEGEWVFDTNRGSAGWETLADFFGNAVAAHYGPRLHFLTGSRTRKKGPSGN
jgi:hypothetical protein